MAKRYKLTDLGEINHFLGLHITRDRSKRRLSIDQRHYICTILERFNLTSARPTFTPLAAGTKLVANQGQDSDADLRKRYQSIVGSLMYAMLGTRPDICFAVNRLSQFGANPNQEHLVAAQHVLRYLSQMCDFELIYNADNTEIHAYCDSHWASDPNSC